MAIYKDQPELAFVPKSRQETCRRILGEIKAAMVFGSFGAATAQNPVDDDFPYSARQRNEAIDAILATSNRKCGRYTHFLQQYDANVNSSFGILAQAAAILATVSSGGTAEGFAALAGISSGARGTLNQAHFSNQTIGVLTRAFEISRAEQRRQIANLQQCSPTEYTLMRGMEDAFRYHSTCSIVEGLKQTQRAVEQSSSPDLDSFIKLLDQMKDAQDRIAGLSPARQSSAGAAGAAGGEGTGSGAGAGAGADGSANGGAGAQGQTAAGGTGSAGTAGAGKQKGAEGAAGETKVAAGGAGTGDAAGTSGGSGGSAPACPLRQARQRTAG
jgi:hypothetical protein